MRLTIRPQWLVVIDFPDERLGGRSEFNHMHAWFATEGEADVMSRLLADRVGGTHEIFECKIGAVCPRCGRLAVPEKR